MTVVESNMKNFNIYEDFDREDAQRFPEWAVGAEFWSDWFRRGNWRAGESAIAFDKFLSGARGQPNQPPLCPRVFISHRQIDRAEALRLAWLAHSVGVEFWLDVLDPNLQALAGQPAPPIVIASIIEIALLNSTHVVGLLTPNSRGSMWLPYEFGRVKERRHVSQTAATWLHPNLVPVDDAEYTHLGVRHSTESNITVWLSAELKKWQTTYGSCHSDSRSAWTGGRTMPLP
jgi:hypothetical protein